MKRTCGLLSAGILAIAIGTTVSGAAKDIDAAFTAFWEARNPPAAFDSRK